MQLLLLKLLSGGLDPKAPVIQESSAVHISKWSLCQSPQCQILICWHLYALDPLTLNVSWYQLLRQAALQLCNHIYVIASYIAGSNLSGLKRSPDQKLKQGLSLPA